MVAATCKECARDPFVRPSVDPRCRGDRTDRGGASSRGLWPQGRARCTTVGAAGRAAAAGERAALARRAAVAGVWRLHLWHTQLELEPGSRPVVPAANGAGTASEEELLSRL